MDEWDDFTEPYVIFLRDGKYEVQITNTNKVYIVDSFAESIEIVENYSILAARMLEGKERNLMELFPIYVTEEDLDESAANDKFGKTLPAEVKILYDKYKFKYPFGDVCLENDREGLYAVYLYRIKNDSRIVYIGYSKNDFEIEANQFCKYRVSLIENAFQLECEIILDGLDRTQAEIYSICLTLKYIDEGQYIINGVADYYRTINHKEPRNYEDIRVNKNEFYSVFFPEIDQKKVDLTTKIEIQDLEKYAYYKDIGDSKYQALNNFLESINACKIKDYKGSGVKTVILTRPIDFLVYKQLIDNGKKIVSAEYLSECIDQLSNEKVIFTEKIRVKRPKFAEGDRLVLRQFILENADNVRELSASVKIKNNEIPSIKLAKSTEEFKNLYLKYFPLLIQKDFEAERFDIYRDVLVRKLADAFLQFGLYDECLEMYEKYGNIDGLAGIYYDKYDQVVRCKKKEELELKTK